MKILQITLAFYLRNGVFLLSVLPRLSLVYFIYYLVFLYHTGSPFNHRHTLASLCSDNGFEEGLSTLALVSGLFGAMWSVG